ncbi:MAG: glycosyltransferase WbsX family protein [Panacagrimonas sp.]
MAKPGGHDIAIDGAISNARLPTRGQLIARLKSLANRDSASPIAQRESILRRESSVAPNGLEPRVRAIAFYLPQFHPVPENDQWWGKGFTEWTNVVTAQPAFDGHAQPRIPSELGYYDLRTPGVIEQQIELALAHGLSGFCFHHYWFGGKRLLVWPLERFLEIDHDLGFCLCWANEPWSRRWDGSEQELLMPQPHSLEQDIAFIHDVMPYLQDSRYIRIDGAPILIVYRVGLLSSAPQVFDRWRQIAVESGLPGLHICMAETFGSTDPQAHGCDSSVEFPPHRIVAGKHTDRPGSIPNLSPEFQGTIFDYGDVVTGELAASDPDYLRFKTVMLGWDNTSRRGNKAHVFHQFSRSMFETWLEDACQRTERRCQGDQRLLFINAWNEWGEGTYLEPDRLHGRQMLQAVRDILTGHNPTAASLTVLRERLAGDPAALSALERVEDHFARLQASLKYSLEQLRQAPQALVGTQLTAIPPPGLVPVKTVTSGKLEQIALRVGARATQVRTGTAVYCSGWAIPGDRRLVAGLFAYLKVSAQDGGGPSYGLVTNWKKRADSAKAYVEHRTSSAAAAAAMPSRSRLQRLLPGKSDDEAPLPASDPGGTALPPDATRHLVNGFAVTFDTRSLAPGRYTLSMVFPSHESEKGTACEVPLDGLLEIVA